MIAFIASSPLHLRAPRQDLTSPLPPPLPRGRARHVLRAPAMTTAQPQPRVSNASDDDDTDLSNPSSPSFSPPLDGGEECPVYCYVACSPTRSDYLERVLTSNVYDLLPGETPLQRAPLLSDRLHPHNVYLKREDATAVNSFKLRGAYNMISRQPRAVLQKGIVAASAGNHAQGVALSAQKLGIPATIVMPAVTPQIKVDAVKRRGANAVLHGDNFDQAKALAMQMAAERGMMFIPPFDHPDIIAGQATVGLELIRQLPAADAIFVPIGGGGLAAGIATVVKRLKPSTKVIGVEPIESAAMYHSIKLGKRVRLNSVSTFADGVAVVEVGEENFRLCRDLVDDIVLVSNDEICAAIKDVFEDTRSILEPAGALAVAGLKRWVSNRNNEANFSVIDDDATTTTSTSGKSVAKGGNSDSEGLKLVAIASGANTNFDALRHVSERAEIGEGREGIFAISIPEKPGMFRKLIQSLGADTIVTEFNYRLRDQYVANIFVGTRIAGLHDRNEIISKIADNPEFTAIDLTDDEMTKLHVRHLVGGSSEINSRKRRNDSEMVIRFEFPERPGALYKFLAEIPEQFNITMFHYRNHGADVGRVLVGLTYLVKSNGGEKVNRANEYRLLDEFVNRLGYKYVKENKNVAYKLFLS